MAITDKHTYVRYYKLIYFFKNGIGSTFEYYRGGRAEVGPLP